MQILQYKIVDYTKPTFLTQKNIDHEKLIKILYDQILKIKETEDQVILKNIIHNFKCKDFSLLSPQQIQ